MRLYLQDYNYLNLNIMQFESDNNYGIPTIKKEDIKIEEINKLIAFVEPELDGWCHFFIDDYRFERIWRSPVKYLNKIKKYKGVLSPDFSLYLDYPLVIQIWNTYRNRWLGAFWQMHGIKVIPTLSWSDERSYDFCFLGVEEGSIVAISTVGLSRDSTYLDLFIKGFLVMNERIKPKNIIVYGDKDVFTTKELLNYGFLENAIFYEPFYKKIALRRNRNGRKRSVGRN